MPRSAVAGPEPELEQQREPAIVGVPVAVVERLLVVGVGAGLQQQPRERELVRMGRRIALAAAERSGQRGERWAEPLPQVAGIRVGAVVEQHTRSLECVAPRSGGTNPGVGEIEQRLPVERAALPVCRLGVAGEQIARGGRVADRGDRMNRRGRELGVGGEELPRLRPPRGVVVAVVQARQAEELVDSSVVVGDRLADRLVGRRARVPLGELDVRLQLAPSSETRTIARRPVGRPRA